MSKKQHPVSQVLKLVDGLDENERSIVRDYLRAPRQRGGATKKPSSKKAFAKVLDAPLKDVVAVAAGGD